MTTTTLPVEPECVDALWRMIADATVCTMCATPGGPIYSVVDITPALADAIIKFNTHNRSMKSKQRGLWTRLMVEGKWDSENGDAIRLAQDGTLVDGQHRLQSIVDSETTQRTLVVTNLKLETQSTVDRGSKRSASDDFKIAGETNSDTIAAVCRRVWAWRQGYRWNVHNPPRSASEQELVDVLGAHPEIRDSVAVALRVKREMKTGALPAVLGLCHFVFSELDAEAAEDFFEKLATGASMESGNPILVLRNAATKWVSKGKGARTSEMEQLALVMKTWKGLREGREVKTLRLRREGPTPEKVFPEPH